MATPYIDDRNDDHYFIHHPDLGCEVASRCLSCPLEFCKEDDPAKYQLMLRREKDSVLVDALDRLVEFRPLERQDQITQEITHQFGVTQRTVWKTLQRFRAYQAAQAAKGRKET